MPGPEDAEDDGLYNGTPLDHGVGFGDGIFELPLLLYLVLLRLPQVLRLARQRLRVVRQVQQTVAPRRVLRHYVVVE